MKSDALAVTPIDRIDPANSIQSLDARLERTICDLTVGVPAELVGTMAMVVRAAFLAGFVTRDEVAQATAGEWAKHFLADTPKWIVADLTRGRTVNRNSLKGNGS